eukprot:TRINITY_DN61462_c0_g1_i1.p2 TRINITY_DN61462_c0_g1~~TRINITY_DN61462_c0_g1_i1.p2  ORF type:complete len:107 (-),score=27.08 TRINITY_DN61462_c0_g1_i1:61-381(-)
MKAEQLSATPGSPGVEWNGSSVWLHGPEGGGIVHVNFPAGGTAPTFLVVLNWGDVLEGVQVMGVPDDRAISSKGVVAGKAVVELSLEACKMLGEKGGKVIFIKHYL